MLHNADTQIAAFLQRLPASAHTPAQENPHEPIAIFRGGLELTREQEEFVVQRALRFAEDLETESGRNGGRIDDPEFTSDVAGDIMSIEGMKPMAQRDLWDLVYHQKFEWRKRLVGGIYAEGQNVHLPHTRRFVQQMIARAQNYFFQTEPWVSATPVPPSMEGLSVDTATAANEWAQYKLNEAQAKSQFEKAIELAFIRGECVLRIEEVERIEYYETFANVAIDPATREAIMAADGDYIFEADEFALAVTADGQAGGMVLKRDGVTPMPAGELTFDEMKVRRKNVIYAGPQIDIVPHRDLLVPLNAKDLDEAEFIGEYTDIPAIEIVEDYIRRLEKVGVWDEKEYPRVMGLLRDVSGRTSETETQGSEGRASLGESANEKLSSRGDAMVHAIRCHMWIDANNDGQRENIVVLIDKDTQRPILIDYVANVYRNRRRPYRTVRVNPVDGRWHGQSVVGIFWQLQKFSDLTVARWEMSTSRAGKVILWSPRLTVEGAKNPALVLNAGTTYTKANPATKAEEIVEVVSIYDFEGASLQELLGITQQMMTNLSGVANANDAAMAGLETSKLATGVKNIDRSGQEQFAPLISHLESGITLAAEDCVYLAVAHARDDEVFHVMGPQGALLIKQLSGADLRQFKWQIRLEMTRYRSEQEAAQADQAIDKAMLYEQLPPHIKLKLAPLFRQRLKANGVRDVDSVIVLPTEQELMAAMQQPQQPVAA